MIASFLDTVGESVAERWAAALNPLAVLFVAAVWIGAMLGHAHALDGKLLIDKTVHKLAHLHGGTTPAVIVVGAGLAGVSLAALLAEQARALVEWCWLAAGPRWWVRLSLDGQFGRWKVWRGRRSLWSAAEAAYRSVGADGAQEAQRQRARLADARNRIGLSEPRRPTWIGDRLRVVGERVEGQYGLDLGAAWPRLWLIIPDGTRTELRAAHAAFAGAATSVAWGVLLLVLGIALWWPAVIASILLTIAGWRAGRQAADVLAALTEAAVDVHVSGLARELLPTSPSGPPTPAIGREMSERMRKGA